MDTVSATPASPNAATGARTPGQHGTLINSDFQTFLLMLTTQMQNQDPLNPIDSTDYAQQLATFSGVEQQVKTNTILQSLSAQLGLSGMAEMAGWVGMEARTAAAVRFEGAPVTLYPAPAHGADQAVLVVHDGTGREVMRVEVPVSGNPVTWAGTDLTGAPLPNGTYGFTLENYAEGEPIGTTGVETYGRIDEVRNGPDGVELLLESGATLLPEDVRALRHPHLS